MTGKLSLYKGAVAVNRWQRVLYVWIEALSFPVQWHRSKIKIVVQ